MRITASTYLNSAPLIYSFAHGSLRHHFTFIGDAAPSRCATMLAAGQCEVALIPVIEYQRIPGLKIIPEIAVASKNRVRSVILVARRPLNEVRTVTLDTSSRTSQALVKLLFLKRYRASPQFTERIPDATMGCENMLEGSDAALVIGDPGMRLEASSGQLGLQIYDLAEEWRAMTGLPFVFAVWAVRERAIEDAPDLFHDFIAAKREGLEQIGRIASQYAIELNLPEDDLIRYLRDNVNYDLDEENIAGLQRYFSLAYECGLIPENRELRFLRK
jgi:chorismate dehydratase